MNAPLKAIGSQGKVESKLEATMRDIGRDARQAARALALAPAAQKNRALAAMAKAIRGSQAAILAANREDLAEAKASGATAAFLDRLDSRCGADRGHGGRPRCHPQAQRSGRHRLGVVAAAQWHAHRARARAARRRRRDLREPAQCDGGCRRALPQGRQCRDPARRFRKLPLGRRDPRRAGRGSRRKPGCQPRRSRWCRPATAPRSA